MHSIYAHVQGIIIFFLQHKIFLSQNFKVLVLLQLQFFTREKIQKLMKNFLHNLLLQIKPKKNINSQKNLNCGSKKIYKTKVILFLLKKRQKVFQLFCLFLLQKIVFFFYCCYCYFRCSKPQLLQSQTPEKCQSSHQPFTKPSKF